MCEVVADEYGCIVSGKPIAIFTQSGDDRYDNADKMIIKGAQVLPHALINNVETKLGKNGEKLAEYVAWLRDRILNNRKDDSYSPVMHIDVYGTIDQIFGHNAASYRRRRYGRTGIHIQHSLPSGMKQLDKSSRAIHLDGLA